MSHFDTIQNNKKGIYFGSITGMVTTLSVIIGLSLQNVTTHIIITSVLLFSISDGLAESFGFFLSNNQKEKTMSNRITDSIILFFSKILISFMIVLPFFILNHDNQLPLLLSNVIGFILLSIISITQSYSVKDFTIKFSIYTFITILIVIISIWVGFIV